jgi:hypothetical protein
MEALLKIKSLLLQKVKMRRKLFKKLKKFHLKKKRESKKK